jgi:hypothetical protein
VGRRGAPPTALAKALPGQANRMKGTSSALRLSRDTSAALLPAIRLRSQLLSGNSDLDVPVIASMIGLRCIFEEERFLLYLYLPAASPAAPEGTTTPGSSMLPLRQQVLTGPSWRATVQWTPGL